MAYNYDDINGFYNKYLGRTVGDQNSGWATWANDPNAEQNIKNSGEGQAYAQRATAPSGETNKGTQPQAPQQAPQQPAPAPAPPASAAPAQPYNSSLGTDENYFNSLFKPGQFSASDLAAHKADLAAHGITYNGGDTITDSQGRVIDVLGNYNPTTGMGENQWLPPGSGNGGGANGAGGAGGGAGSGGNAGSVSGTINGSSNSATDPMGEAVRAAIMKQINGLQSPTDANSSTVHDITDPYHLQNQRGLEATRRALAEQAYANGNLNTGGYGESQIKAVENAGANEANFTGQTVATQEAERKSMLMNLLGLGNNSSQFSQQLSATQKNFADQLAQQDSQFRASLAQNVAQYGQSMGYQYALLDWNKKQTGINGATAPVAP